MCIPGITAQFTCISIHYVTALFSISILAACYLLSCICCQKWLYYAWYWKTDWLSMIRSSLLTVAVWQQVCRHGNNFLCIVGTACRRQWLNWQWCIQRPPLGETISHGMLGKRSNSSRCCEDYKRQMPLKLAFSPSEWSTYPKSSVKNN